MPTTYFRHPNYMDVLNYLLCTLSIGLGATCYELYLGNEYTFQLPSILALGIAFSSIAVITNIQAFKQKKEINPLFKSIIVISLIILIYIFFKNLFSQNSSEPLPTTRKLLTLLIFGYFSGIWISFFINQIKITHHRKIAKKLSSAIQLKIHDLQEIQLINKKEDDTILYIEKFGKKAKVVTKNRLYEIGIKDINDVLEQKKDIIKCHNNYWINASFILHLKPNKNGLSAILKGTKNPVQISSQFVSPIEKIVLRQVN